MADGAAPPPAPPGDTFPRRKIQEALQLFSEIERTTTITDARDDDRLRFAATMPLKPAAAGAAPDSGRGKGDAKRTPRSLSVGRGSTADTKGEVAALKQKLEVAEAINKKLHAKNKDLQSELDKLKGTVSASPAPSADGGGPGSPVPVKSSPPPTAAVAPVAAPKPPTPPNLPPPARATVAMETELASLRAQVKGLKQQLDDTIAAKVECIVQGEATGRVNKEVKAFFVSTRQKQLDDAARFDAERALWQAQIMALEDKVSSLPPPP